MIKNSARFNAGHFFKQALAVQVFLLLLLSCTDKENTANADSSLIECTCDTPVLIRVPCSEDFLPEAVEDIENTSFGRFFPASEGSDDPFHRIAAQADSAGMLILAILQEGMEWSGNREHLVIWLDSLGVPVLVQPEMNSSLLADSLWTDPLIRQNTIAELIEFTRPDIVMEELTESSRIEEITAFWSRTGQEKNITACLYCMPDHDKMFRGWGIFTGNCISGIKIQGMAVNDFHASFLLLAELEWIETGYPVLSTFLQMESE